MRGSITIYSEHLKTTRRDAMLSGNNEILQSFLLSRNSSRIFLCFAALL